MIIFVLIFLFTLYSVNLRKYANPKNANPPSVNQNQSPNENESNQTRKLRSGRKLPNLNQKTSQRTTRPSITTKNKQDHPGSPHHETHPQYPPQAPNTPTVSNVANQWKNLDNPFSYSGNTATILDQIKSFS